VLRDFKSRSAVLFRKSVRTRDFAPLLGYRHQREHIQPSANAWANIHNTTMMVDRPDGSEQRRSKIVAAARWVTIDYRSIVANAVAGLANNTPDARRDVYAEARGVVHRHLQLMRLPEPIIELEKLALDRTIRKIERQTRAERAAPEEEPAEVEEEAEPTVRGAARSFGTAAGEVAQAFTSLMIVLGLRPVLPVLRIAAPPLRFFAREIFSPVGLAAGLPITALLVTTFYLLDTHTGFQSTVNVRTAQFLEHVDTWLNGSAPPVAGKDEGRVAGPIEPLASVGTAPARAVPARARVAASSRGRNGVYAPPSQANAVGALAPPSAPLGALSAGPAMGNPNAPPDGFRATRTCSKPRQHRRRRSMVRLRPRPRNPRQRHTHWPPPIRSRRSLMTGRRSRSPPSAAHSCSESRRADRGWQEGRNRRRP
jgi:hypothetical protein